MTSCLAKHFSKFLTTRMTTQIYYRNAFPTKKISFINASTYGVIFNVLVSDYQYVLEDMSLVSTPHTDGISTGAVRGPLCSNFCGQRDVD